MKTAAKTSISRDVIAARRISPGAAHDDGFMIVAVLWILAALAALASVYALYVASTAAGARVGSDRIRAEALVTAGIELTAYRLLGAQESARPTSGAFSFQLGEADVGVEFQSEGARIDLNLAPKELLAGLFKTLGAQPEAAQNYADRVIGWRNKDDVAGQSKESEVYRDAGLSYGPRKAPFQNVDELRLVASLPPELVEKALPFVTVFNGRAEIDVILAAPEIVAALPKINPDMVAEILEKRQALKPQAVLSLLGAARSSVAIDPRKATRTKIRVAFENGRSINAEVVILVLEPGGEPYRILSWRDDFDGPV
ncbi:general secretion pathway protein GspK [Methylocapsa acidiphila]|uniref:general secretion pathway protein GspK n=1 Tax=Methylocapsa acidiphila TaxID=133552 RepID=UPI000A0151C6|nr:type II secretion system protein GspK [Methylocapsa acidiphila]